VPIERLDVHPDRGDTPPVEALAEQFPVEVRRQVPEAATVLLAGPGVDQFLLDVEAVLVGQSVDFTPAPPPAAGRVTGVHTEVVALPRS